MGPIKYELTDSELRIKMGPFVVRKLPYSDMEQVQAGYTFLNEHWCNVWPFQFVTIRRKTGFIKSFVINPADTQAFVEQLRAKLIT